VVKKKLTASAFFFIFDKHHLLFILSRKLLRTISSKTSNYPPNTSLSPQEKSKRTFRYDRIRSVFNGVADTGYKTFALLVAIRIFDASANIKALVAAGPSIGLILIPLSLFIFSKLRWSSSKACTVNYVLGGIAMAFAALSHNFYVFVFGIIFGGALLMQQPPLLVHIYSENYAPNKQGGFVAQAIALSCIVAMGFSYLGGKLLDKDINYYHFVFLFMTVTTFASALSTSRIPSTQLPSNSSKNPLKSFSHAWKDKIFGSMLVIWMFLGFGNLTFIPLQVEYLVNPKFGINATNTQVALAIGIIPLTARLLSTQIWGYLYDRYNFFLVRGLISSAFAIGHLIFFNSHSIWNLCLAGAMTGIGTGGAQIAWSLWVTKFAPPDKAPEYMGVHTFLTGARGIITPFIGFYLITIASPFGLSIIAATLISISIVLLVPLKFAAEKKARLAPKTN
jgi:hypothetical protein